MGLLESAYDEMRSLSARQMENVYKYILFEKYNNANIPGMPAPAPRQPQPQFNPEDIWPMF